MSRLGKREPASRELGGSSLAEVSPLQEATAAQAKAARLKNYQTQLRQLNVAFARAVQENEGSSHSLASEVRQYLQYVQSLQETFKDVLLLPAAPPSARAGDVYVVGSGDFGQLGLGEEAVEKARPVKVDAFGGSTVRGLACGGMHTLAVTADGSVYSWGVNDEGALGRTVRTARVFPRLRRPSLLFYCSCPSMLRASVVRIRRAGRLGALLSQTRSR